MEQEIKDIIAKNLPAHVGEALQKRLAQADAFQKQSEDQAAIIKILDNEILQKSKQILAWEEKESKYADLVKKEKDLSDRERALEINQLKYEIQAEKDKTAFAKEVALGLVRNTNYRTSVYSHEDTPVTNNGYTSTQTMNKSSNTDIKAD